MIKIKKYQIEDYISDSTQSSLNLKADLVGGKVPANQLPSFVDDVIEVANYAVLPIPGTAGVIYITLDTNKVYRWTGSVYVEIASGVTNLSYAPGVSNGVINSDTGSDAVIPLADVTNAGLFSATEKTKLSGIAVGAEVNINADWNATTGDAQILNKPTISGTNTGDQNLQQVTDLGAETTNSITVGSLDYYSLIAPDAIGTENKTTGSYAFLGADGVLGLKNGTIDSLLKNTNATNNNVVLEFPDKPTGSYTIATTSDVVTQNLQQVTDEGDTTTNNIQFIDSAEVIFGAGGGILLDNTSRLREGTIDAGLGGSKGIAQICGVGYELKWEAGRLYVMNGNGNAIRESLYNFNIVPTVDEDNTKGYYQGSLWSLDNGDVYECSDSTTGAAVWFLKNTGSTPNLQQVTDEGAVTTNDITANSFIKEGGFDFQFLKADGSVDNNAYLTSADLPSTLDLYATTSPDPVIAGYTALVRNIADSRYNTTAVNVPTPTITGTLASPTFCGAVISDPSILLGNPGVFNFSLIGKIRRVGGSTSSGADFFFTIYKRDISGVETLIADSSPVVVPANGGIYVEYISIALWNNGIFLSTDRVVLKFYGIKSGTGSGATYEFLFGGADPVRGTAAISSAIIPNLYLRDLADVEKIDALNNEVLYWNDPASLWEHSLVENLVPDASATQKGLVSTGLQTIAGLKTFTSNIRLPVSLANTSATVVYGSPSTGELFIGFDSIGPTALEMQYVKGITSSVQTQLNGKQPTLTAGNGIDITSNTISTVNTSIGAYKILANNTNASAVPTEQVFKDITEKTLSNTNIVWTGTTAPSGTSNHTYRWSQVGRLVTIRVSLNYTVAGNSLISLSIPFDNMSDLPIPATITGFTGNGEVVNFGAGMLGTTKNIPSLTSIGVGFSLIRRNLTGTGTVPYDLCINRNSASYQYAFATIQYYTT